MSKVKSIICLSIIVFVMLFVGVFAVMPTFAVGVYDYHSPLSSVKLGLDLKGGVYVTFEVDPESLEGIDNEEDAIVNTARIMQDRLAAKGYTEAVVTAVNSAAGDRKNIRVEIPDVDDPDEAFDILSKPAKLEIRILSEDGDLVTEPTNIIGATAVIDQDNSNYYAVQLRLNRQGQSDMSKATSGLSYGSDKIYFILDGEVISEPAVQTQINSEYSTISGQMSREQAEALAIQISSGAYEISFKEQIERRVISPTLGEEAIQTVLIAGIISLVVIIIFMVLIYGMFGVAASLALFGYIVLMILALAFLPFVQLTLPGIAGIILGIGMAVDANIIIFERIKDEYRNGKSFRSSYQDGFKRSLSAILDSNITTLIGAITLWVLASGSVQGFAITLVFSVVISLFSSLLMTRLFCNLLMPITGDRAGMYRLKKLDDVKQVEVG